MCGWVGGWKGWQQHYFFCSVVGDDLMVVAVVELDESVLVIRSPPPPALTASARMHVAFPLPPHLLIREQLRILLDDALWKLNHPPAGKARAHRPPVRRRFLAAAAFAAAGASPSRASS